MKKYGSKRKLEGPRRDTSESANTASSSSSSSPASSGSPSSSPTIELGEPALYSSTPSSHLDGFGFGIGITNSPLGGGSSSSSSSSSHQSPVSEFQDAHQLDYPAVVVGDSWSTTSSSPHLTRFYSDYPPSLDPYLQVPLDSTNAAACVPQPPQQQQQQNGGGDFSSSDLTGWVGGVGYPTGAGNGYDLLGVDYPLDLDDPSYALLSSPPTASVDYSAGLESHADGSRMFSPTPGVSAENTPSPSSAELEQYRECFQVLLDMGLVLTAFCFISHARFIFLNCLSSADDSVSLLLAVCLPGSVGSYRDMACRDTQSEFTGVDTRYASVRGYVRQEQDGGGLHCRDSGVDEGSIVG